jgi:hypothetical protein
VRVRVYPADTYGCGYFRLIWACQLLQAQGAEIELVDPGERQLELRVDKEKDARGRVTNEWTSDVVLDDDPPDVMVFQRVSHRFLAGAIPVLNSKGIATVIDIDDDLASVHPSNPAYAALHPKNEYRRTQSGQPSRHSWHHLQAACRDATLVTCSTPALAQRYGSHGRARVLWNYLPDHYYGLEHEDSDLLGWPAAIASHPDDPSATGGAVARLITEGRRFHCVGDPAGVASAFGAPTAEITGIEGVNVYDWPGEVNKIGVGIAPLADTRFNTAKSWLKPLEMSALGIPWVASPRAEYERLHRMGAGITTDRSRIWYRELDRLLSSEELRAEVSGRGREVADRLRLAGHVDEWWSAWEHALHLQRGRIAA